MASKSQESVSTDQIDQMVLGESAFFNANGTKPKQYPTHHNTGDFSSLMLNRTYQDNVVANPAYYWSQWNQNEPSVAVDTNRPRSMSGSSTSLSNREYNSALTKFQTKICDHWRRSGNCSYGESCWYAHGEDDLRKIGVSRNGEKPGKENEKPGSMRREEFQNKMKNGEDPKAAPTSKRTSTNVKGLTVNIPQNIAFKEQSTNASLPLSPAQERWISMTIGTNEKGTESNGFSTGRHEMDGEPEKKVETDRRPTASQFSRDEEMSGMDDYGFLSPNPFPYQQSGFNGRVPSQNQPMHSHHRSYSRGPHHRNAAMQPFGGMPSQQQTGGFARPSRSGTSVGYSGFNERSFPQRSSSSIRSAREQQHLQHCASHPQYPQAIWNVAGELYQRQKDIESSGVRPTMEPLAARKYEEMEFNRLLAQQQAKKQEMAMLEYEAAKMKDLSSVRYLLERGMLNKRQVPKEVWNELTTSPSYNGHSAQQYNNGFSDNGINSSDYCCGSTRSKAGHDHPYTNFSHSHHHHSHPNLRHHQYPQHNQHHHHHHPAHQQFRRSPATPFSGDLPAPPKMFESLLPSDDTFSIWLDPKPKRAGVENSDSGTSLLSKMDALRLEKFPVNEEENALATGSTVRNGKTSSNETLTPVLSLMELLSSENLLDETNGGAKNTMFDFDRLKIAETLKKSSSQNSESQKDDSPLFYLMDDKTPGYDEPMSAKSMFSTSSVRKSSFLEPCDFFAATGSCPFGDGCHLSHSTRNEPLEQQTAH